MVQLQATVPSSALAAATSELACPTVWTVANALVTVRPFAGVRVPVRSATTVASPALAGSPETGRTARAWQFDRSLAVARVVGTRCFLGRQLGLTEAATSPKRER